MSFLSLLQLYALPLVQLLLLLLLLEEYWSGVGSGSDGSGAGDGVKEFWTETARQAKTQWWENLRLI